MLLAGRDMMQALARILALVAWYAHTKNIIVPPYLSGMIGINSFW